MNLFDLPRTPSRVESYLVPFVGLLLIVVLDYKVVDSVLLTPMLSTCLLGALAFRLDTKVLTFWLIIFACNVVWSLVENPGAKPAQHLNWETISVRSFGFVVSGLIAVAMNRGRANLTRNHRHLLEMLERLPCGVVVSDSSGTLLFANKKTGEILGKPVGDIIGLSYFSSFTSPEQRGHAIQHYLRLSDEETASETELTIIGEGEERRTVQATQIPMTLINQKCVITVIDLDGDAPRRRSTDSSDSTWTGITKAMMKAVETAE